MIATSIMSAILMFGYVSQRSACSGLSGLSKYPHELLLIGVMIKIMDSCERECGIHCSSRALRFQL